MGKGKKRARLQLCPASKQGQVDALDGIQAQIPLWTMQDSGTRGSAARGKVANSSPALCSRSDTHSGLLQAFFFVLGSQRHLLALWHALRLLAPYGASSLHPPGPPSRNAAWVTGCLLADRPL